MPLAVRAQGGEGPQGHADNFSLLDPPSLALGCRRCASTFLLALRRDLLSNAVAQNTAIIVEGGDLLVKVKVILPKHLSNEERALFNTLKELRPA